MSYQPKTGEKCHCRPGQQRDNCPACEGTGWRIDFKAIRERKATPPPLFEQVKALGIPYASHATDLYIPVTEQTTALIAGYEFKCNVRTFTNQVEGGQWYDIPFAYLPAWEAKGKRA